jgi:hypothetical protein
MRETSYERATAEDASRQRFAPTVTIDGHRVTAHIPRPDAIQRLARVWARARTDADYRGGAHAWLTLCGLPAERVLALPVAEQGQLFATLTAHTRAALVAARAFTPWARFRRGLENLRDEVCFLATAEGRRWWRDSLILQRRARGKKR